MPNRLADQNQPLLLQHARNPVHWWPWGPEAFEHARDTEPPRAALGGLRHLPLVPRHGARELRGRGGRRGPEPGLRVHQGGPRGAPRRGRRVHGRLPDAHRPGRLAHDHRHDPGQAALLRGHLHAPARQRPAHGPHGHGRAGGAVLAHGPVHGHGQRRGDIPPREPRPVPAVRRANRPRPGWTRPATISGRATTAITAASAGPPKFPLAPRAPVPHLRRHARVRDEGALCPRTWTWPCPPCAPCASAASGTTWSSASTATPRTSAGCCPHFEKMLYDQAMTAVACLEASQAPGAVGRDGSDLAATAADIFHYVRRRPDRGPRRVPVRRGRRQRGRGRPLLPLDPGRTDSPPWARTKGASGPGPSVAAPRATPATRPRAGPRDATLIHLAAPPVRPGPGRRDHARGF